MLEKGDHLWGLHRVFVQLEIETLDGDATNDRKLLPVEVEFQHRGLPFGSPGALRRRLLGQSTFIDKDNGSALLLRPGLELGPALFFPLLDRGLVALSGLTPGLLRTPAHPSQQPPDFR